MRRREFIAGLGGAVAWPLAARAQRRDPVRRIGVLMSNVNNDSEALAELAAFYQGLEKHGWIEGRTVDVEVRWPGADLERVAALAKELIDLKPDAVLSRTTPATAALIKETSTIPIVFVNIASPIEQGFVQSLPRPGGNSTGFTNFDSLVGGKMLQFLKEIHPPLVRVAVIYNPQTAPYAGLYLRTMEPAARALAVAIETMQVQSDADIEAAMTAFALQPGGGVVAIPDSFTRQRRNLLIAVAARNNLPAISGYLGWPSAGGLMAYAVDVADLMYRAAGYVDRILKGETPAELAVQQPTRFNLVINRKVADSLGLAISPQLSVLADEIIE
jgi:putative tryptophan/tyrosine transport system substrate-binding protein